jgi:hypothetical protein
VAYGRGAFLVVGANGTILQSGARPSAVVLSGPWRTSTGMQIRVTGEPGRRVRIQASPDLVGWADISTGVLTGEGYSYIIPDPARLWRMFYRAVLP